MAWLRVSVFTFTSSLPFCEQPQHAASPPGIIPPPLLVNHSGAGWSSTLQSGRSPGPGMGTPEVEPAAWLHTAAVDTTLDHHMFSNVHLTS